MWILAEPLALLLTLPLIGAVVYFLFKKRSTTRRTLIPFSGPRELLQKESRRAKRSFRLLFAVLCLGLLFLIVVVARPIRVKSWMKRFSEGIDIVLVLDVSESMEADDLLPTRILAAKAVIRDFIKRRPDDRIGLVIFGGEAVTKCPLTRDFDFLLAQVEDVRLREVKQGTAIGNGLANGIGRLRNSESKTKVVVLLTDGDSNVGAINPMTAAHLARQEGIKVYTIGIGRSNRVIVPIYNYDIYGRKTQLIAQVPSYLNPELLQNISRITGGQSYMARDTGMLNRILQEIDRLEKTKIKMVPMEKREEFFVLPALLATILLGLGCFLQETRFRKVRPRHA